MVFALAVMMRGWIDLRIRREGLEGREGIEEKEAYLEGRGSKEN